MGHEPSSKQLYALERSGLEKGLKFAINASKRLTAEIFPAYEEGISQLNDDHRHSERAEVRSILRRAKLLPKTFKIMFFRLVPRTKMVLTSFSACAIMHM